MTSITVHSKTAKVELYRGNATELFTKMDLALRTRLGDSQFVSIYFDDLAIESLEQMRDALTAYLAENKVAVNG